jgi:hypothetical protein
MQLWSSDIGPVGSPPLPAWDQPGTRGVVHLRSVVHGSIWPLLPALGALAFALGFIRTGLVGVKLFDNKLQIPRAMGKSIQVSIQEISGVYLVHTLINGYGLTGWVPTIWVNKRPDLPASRTDNSQVHPQS